MATINAKYKMVPAGTARTKPIGYRCLLGVSMKYNSRTSYMLHFKQNISIRYLRVLLHIYLCYKSQSL